MELFEYRPPTETEAQEICRWRYNGAGSVYNFPDWETIVRNGWSLADKDRRESEFLAFSQGGEFMAYGRIFASGGKVFLGIGLKPSWCGRGYGGGIMRILVEEARKRMPGLTIALEVRSFNSRALRCYEKIGFAEKGRYRKDTMIGEDEFIYMEYETLKNQIYSQEMELLKPEVRRSPERIRALLSDCFTEFCSSGKIYRYSKGDVFGSITGSSEITGFEIQELGGDCILATYRLSVSESPETVKSSLRSSIWKIEDGMWKMFFHQGTPAKD